MANILFLLSIISAFGIIKPYIKGINRIYFFVTSLILFLSFLWLIPGGSSNISGDQVASASHQGVKIARRGESVSFGDYEITIRAIELMDNIDSPFREYNSDSDHKILAIVYSIRNLTNSPMRSSQYPEVMIMDPSGSQYGNDFDAYSALSDKYGLRASITDIINPNDSQDIIAAFKVQKINFDINSWLLFVDGEDDVMLSLK